MITVYIAGPMRGYPRYNFDAFDAATKRWREWGHTVISPAEMDLASGFDPDTSECPTPAGMRQCIKRDLLAIINECNAVALLPGWEKSAGVKVEKALGEFLGLDFFDTETGEYLGKHPSEPKADTQNDVPVSLTVGQVFSGGDYRITKFARELQSAGARFEYKFRPSGKAWRLNKSGELTFIYRSFDYRLATLPSVKCSVNSDGTSTALEDSKPEPRKLHIDQVFSSEDKDLCREAQKLKERGAQFQFREPGESWRFAAAPVFTLPGFEYRMISISPDMCDDYPEQADALNDSQAGELPTNWIGTATPRKQIEEMTQKLRGESILEEAIRITAGDRQASYGPPDQDFQRTAAMWQQILGCDVEARQVAMCMIALKLSRETHQRKRDNWVDIAGYAKCGSLCN